MELEEEGFMSSFLTVEKSDKVILALLIVNCKFAFASFNLCQLKYSFAFPPIFIIINSNNFYSFCFHQNKFQSHYTFNNLKDIATNLNEYDLLDRHFQTFNVKKKLFQPVKKLSSNRLFLYI
jgi:hypothetical protein